MYYTSTEGLETVISNLATRDELRRQILFSVPKMSEFLGLQFESGLFFGKKVQKWSDFALKSLNWRKID